MPNKKIIIIGPTYPYRGGNSLFISHIYDLLKEEFDVKIYNYKLLYPSILFPGTTQIDKSQSIIKKANSIRIINSVSPFSWIYTAKRLKQENADLIVFDWWHPFFSFCHFTISYLIKKKYNDKILFITENIVSHESHFIDRILTKIGLKNANKFLALSDNVAKNLRDVSEGKKIYKSQLPIYDCYNEIEHGASEALGKYLGIMNGNKVLLFFGYVRKYKGLDILLNAMPDLLKFDHSFRLLVVGEFYDDESTYREIIKKNELENYVILINKFVPNEEVAPYFSLSDLVILPYRNATQSGILNIAYGFLKPVLVTNVGGLAEFVEEGETGFVIQPNSVKEIVAGVKNFYDMKSKINFDQNIKNIVGRNSFKQLPMLFNQIINNN